MFAAGKQATKHADAYVFITVFFAAVLFFAGMSLRFAWPLMRSIVLGFGVRAARCTASSGSRAMPVD